MGKVQINFNNTTEIDEVSQDLENGFQLINPDIDDSIYQNLLLTRQEANSIFETLRISLPTITTLDIGLNPQPLITIVYSIYGSIDNYDLIDSLNNFTDVTSISGNINIISA